jgi:dienelactone hydrolase
MNSKVSAAAMVFFPPSRVLRLLVLLAASAAGPIAVSAAPASPRADVPVMLQSFLDREAHRLDAQFLAGITNRAGWESQRPERYREYMEMLGLWPLPERTPLQAQVTGMLERSEGFRVEKLHFQSRPHLYVTANLYLPKDARPGAKLPGVLYVCGHSGKGRDGNKTAFQQHGMWFATHGYACLIIDTLQLGEIAAIHHGTYRYNRWWWQARGYTPSAVECWNGVRALDYLQSRPEVDPDRLAVTGISGGGAASFWIAAADERVKVAVPVSGMSDLEDYVGAKVVNGHCDCMFLLNTFQWPWTEIAALVAPRPLLFANSGHDTIFPMTGNDRIRARLETLYSFYTNRTDRLFDIAVTPGGHDDKVELRLMAYRWINRHLKGEDSPVTEPELPPFPGSELRAFPDALPADELNTRIDESFVAMAALTAPRTAAEFQERRQKKLEELRRLVFRSLPSAFVPAADWKFNGRRPGAGTLKTEPGIEVAWRYLPGRATQWIIVLAEDESLDSIPSWVRKVAGDGALFLLAPRGTAPSTWPDPAPYYVHRSLPLLGRTVDTCRLADTLGAVAHLVGKKRDGLQWAIAGRGSAGVIAAYAALLEPGLSSVVLVEPPASHRAGPIFPNVLRVTDVPEALSWLAPRPLVLYTAEASAFALTADTYRLLGTSLEARPWP